MHLDKFTNNTRSWALLRHAISLSNKSGSGQKSSLSKAAKIIIEEFHVKSSNHFTTINRFVWNLLYDKLLTRVCICKSFRLIGNVFFRLMTSQISFLGVLIKVFYNGNVTNFINSIKFFQKSLYPCSTYWYFLPLNHSFLPHSVVYLTTDSLNINQYYVVVAMYYGRSISSDHCYPVYSSK